MPTLSTYASDYQLQAGDSLLITQSGTVGTGGIFCGGNGTIDDLGVVLGGVSLFGDGVIDCAGAMEGGIVSSGPAGYQNDLTITNSGHLSGGIRANGNITLTSTGTLGNGIYSYGTAGTSIIKNYGALTHGIYGIFIAGNAAITNGSTADTAAYIQGAYRLSDIEVLGVGTIANYGTFETGIEIGSGTITNGSSGDTKATMKYSVTVLSGIGRVTNFGTMAGANFQSANGTVVNYGSMTTGVANAALLINHAVIRGSYGVNSKFGGVIENGGTIDDTRTSLTSLGALLSGGYIVNTGSASLIEGENGVGIRGSAATTGTIVNYGTIDGVESVAMKYVGFGVIMEVDGSVTNGSVADPRALITGYRSGIYAVQGTDVTNFGTIRSRGTAAGGDGVYLGSSGTLTNGAAGDATALIAGASYGVLIARQTHNSTGAVTPTLSNFGLIQSTGTATIAIGVDCTLPLATIANLGTIKSTSTVAGGAGIVLAAGGSVTNGSASDTKALISGPVGAITVTGSAGIVTNFATLSGTPALYLAAGGTITNGSTSDTIAAIVGGILFGTAGTLVNDGTINGNKRDGVTLTAGGRVTNGGTGDTHALIEGYDGLSIAGQLTLANYGTIRSTGTGAKAAGLDFTDGGSFTNGASSSASGLVAGTYAAVWFGGAAGTVSNFGTLSASGTAGSGVALLAGGRVVNGASAAADHALIAGVAQAILVKGAAGTIDNFGTIAATLSAKSAGIVLAAGGAIVNGSSLVGNAATIAGAAEGILIDTAGTVTNFGIVQAVTTLANGFGILLAAGGLVTNEVGASETSGGEIAGFDGIVIRGGTGTVVNHGTIGTTSYQTHKGGGSAINMAETGLVTNQGEIVSAGSGSVGVLLAAGGTIANSFGPAGSVKLNGVILGYDAIIVRGAAGTITNQALIQTGTSAAKGIAISLDDGGSILDTGTIAGGAIGIDTGGAAATITNDGTIMTDGPSASQLEALLLTAGGVVDTTGTAAQILGEVRFTTKSGIVVNGGTIANTGTDSALDEGGIDLLAGGSVQNQGSIDGTNDGILVQAHAGTVTNLGRISGTGSASLGVSLANGGTIVNGGTANLGARIAGVGAAVEVAAATGIVTNFGVLAGGTLGAVILAHGGRLTNGTTSDTTAAITGGPDTVLVEAATGVVLNYGTIGSVSGKAGIVLEAGGSVTNGGASGARALIGAYLGVETTGAAAAVLNLGTIASTSSAKGGIGIDLVAGGRITNGSSAARAAAITGPTAVALGANGILVDWGTIDGTGGTAVAMATAADTLILEGGSHIAGAVAGGGGTLVLDRAGGAGVITGLGSTLVDLGTISIVTGADWTLSGDEGISTSLVDAGAGVIAGTLGNTGRIETTGAGVLDLAANAALVNHKGAVLDLASSGTDTAATGALLTNVGLIEAVSGTSRATVAANILNNGTIETVTGTLDLTGTIGGTGTAELRGGTLDFAGAVGAGQAIAFDAGTTTLVLGDPAGSGLGFAGTIYNFGTLGAETIDVPSFPSTGAKLAWVQQGSVGTLTITDSPDSAKIVLFGQYQNTGFAVAANSSGGISITYTPPTPAESGLAVPHR